MDVLVLLLVSFLITIFGFWFIPTAAIRLRLVVTNSRKLKRFLLLKTISIISFIIVVIFPHQDWAEIMTLIGLSTIFPLLNKLWKQKKYAATIAIGICTVEVLFFGYLILSGYPIGIVEAVIYWILLALAWLIAKHEILFDCMGILFID